MRLPCLSYSLEPSLQVQDRPKNSFTLCLTTFQFTNLTFNQKISNQFGKQKNQSFANNPKTCFFYQKSTCK
ncbi:MAG: hypothetical protein ACJAWV_002140 [Flammeovirgaceae bacterium]|jgi:hypothetical protein